MQRPGAELPGGHDDGHLHGQDKHGNVSAHSFNVIVKLLLPPTITVPADMTAVEATGLTGSLVSYQATATDAVETIIQFSCAPASGSLFPIGTTTVLCTATNHALQTATASFTVTVRDTVAPSMTAPANVSVPASDANGALVAAAVLGAPVATDAVGPVMLSRARRQSVPGGDDDGHLDGGGRGGELVDGAKAGDGRAVCRTVCRAVCRTEPGASVCTAARPSVTTLTMFDHRMAPVLSVLGVSGSGRRRRGDHHHRDQAGRGAELRKHPGVCD